MRSNEISLLWKNYQDWAGAFPAPMSTDRAEDVLAALSQSLTAVEELREALAGIALTAELDPMKLGGASLVGWRCKLCGKVVDCTGNNHDASCKIEGQRPVDPMSASHRLNPIDIQKVLVRKLSALKQQVPVASVQVTKESEKTRPDVIFVVSWTQPDGRKFKAVTTNPIDASSGSSELENKIRRFYALSGI